MSPETNAVVGCARAFLRPSEGASLRTALAGPLDWDALQRLADDHSVMPLVADAVGRHAGDVVPANILRRFRERFIRITQDNLTGAQEWQRVLRALREADVPAISFKGPALALTAYGNLALREFHDLDLMVHSEDVLRAREVLVGDGYSLWSPLARPTDTALVRSSNRQVCFTNKERGMSVDLHWGALHEMFSFQLDVDPLWQTAYVERQEGMSFLSLSPEHLLLYFCAHGAKHCWRNLCWLCDIACHIQSVPRMDWDECVRLAELTGCGLLLKHTLLLSEEVLELQLPAHIRRYVDDEETRVLAKTAQTFLLREHGDHPGYLGPLRYHLALSKGWRNGASLVFERVFVPAEPDWDRLRLPRPLYFLYYLFRPIRFVVERLAVATRLSR
jgi:hypothetical protein